MGESRSRVALHRAGLPAPVLQWEVRSASGLLVGRVDFGWPELRTVGEFDGRVKYGRLLRPGQEPGDVVFEEKRREDLVRDEDLRVVRWVWQELDRFDPVTARCGARSSGPEPASMPALRVECGLRVLRGPREGHIPRAKWRSWSLDQLYVHA